MSLIDTILAQIAPYDCLGCGAEGGLVCSACQINMIAIPERCYRCRRMSSGDRTCLSCRDSSDLYAVKARTIYGGTAKRLIWKLKFSGAQAAASEMATLLAPLLMADEDVVLVPVPTATSRVRRRGYDQAALLARALSRKAGVPYAPGLRRLGQQHQVGATRQQRIAQLQNAYRSVRKATVQDRHVILIDDVLTTGATLEAAAKVIKAAGAKRVSAIVFAVA